MTELQYYASSLDDYQPLNSTVNNGCDFNKYDPYVEKIRTLFVPSLEPRIYSCLETFVYREDQQSETPYLKRCLDVASAWRKPIDAFSTKFEDCGFLEKMLAQAVKYLIKDSLIDCFLNSIILNNRLNKVCRNLDATGVEKDFLRYLAVWNYINEKDYWIDDDQKTSRSSLGSSDDSIESCNDLDVQVGSGLDTRRTKRCLKKVTKRRVVDDSSETFGKDGNDFSENCSNGNCSSLQFLSRLSIDSSNPEGSKSSGVRRKPRSISQTCPCRPSNCQTYRTKKFQRVDWEGKTLKLRICKICPPTFDCELAKPSRLSKLPLPCKCDDMIAEIVKTDLSVPRTSSITTRKKLQAGVTNICHCINETLGKMSREQVRRCRFHCEILPGSVNFKLVQREPNGCKAVLFTDRVATDKIDEQYTPRVTSVTQKAEIMEQKKSHESDLPIYESTGVDLADEDSQINSNLRIETMGEANFRATSSTCLPESKLDAADQEKSTEFAGEESSSDLNPVNDQTCGCKPSFLDGVEYLDHKIEGDPGTSRVESSELTADGNNSTESPEKAALEHLSGNAADDQTCYCNNSDDNNFEVLHRESEKARDTNCDDSLEATQTINFVKELTPEGSLSRVSGNKLEDQTCLCSPSFTEAFDINHDTEKNQESNSIECLESNVEDFEASNRQESNGSAVISDSQQNSRTGNEKADSALGGAEDNQQVTMSQLNLSCSCSKVKSSIRVEKEIQRVDIGCECPSNSCLCTNKCSDEYEQDCDNRLSDAARVSTLNPVQASKIDSRIPNLLRPILIENSKYFGTAGNAQLQPNCAESRTNSWESHNSKIHQATSMKSKTSFQSNVKSVPILDTEMKEIGGTRSGPKFLPTRTEKPTSFEINESKNKSSLAKSPIRIDTGRVSNSKSQRINISIEMCSESESSGENSFKNQHGVITPQNDLMRSGCIQDLPSMWKPRCHSADARTSREQAISLSKKNAKDECLRHLRRMNACLHSPPRPLESRDYLPPLELPPRMRNPIVHGMSTKSSVRSTYKFDRQSMRQNNNKKNGGSKYPNSNGNRRCCNKIQEHIEMETPNEWPEKISRTTTKPERISPSVIHDNLCHAFSASSVDRMKHLIKTKLRRMLLERDKATNTPKTSLTNEKYRVSVPNGKIKRLPFAGPRCHTIWESRNATDAARTPRTFCSNGRTSLAGASQGDEIKSLFYSTTNTKNLSSEHKDLESANNATCYCLRNGDQSVVSSRITIDQRLVGGSDAPYQKGIDREFRYLWKERQKSVQKFTNKEVECVSNNCDDRLSTKSANLSCTGDSAVAGDASAMLSDLVNSADCNVEATLNECQDQITKCPGKLDWSGNSTSRHIYLYEYDNFESSNDEEERKWCDRKICSRKFNSLSICKQGHAEKSNYKKTQKSHQKRYTEVNSRSYKRQYIGEPTISRNIRASNFLTSKIHATSNIRCHKGLGKLDQDLRSKLLQYVSLCKNVKYSLLKMLRPDDFYEVSSTSIP